MVEYKWVVLSNTTLGTFMASIDITIVEIALPAIFRGIAIDPFTSFEYLLWILFGYSIVTATLLVTFGRISDIFGRVKLYNLGFLVYTVGSVLLYLTPNTGDLGAIELIFFRIVQGIGGAFLFSNGAAIITDAFPLKERGKALGLNQLAFLAGSFVGLVLGGVLAVYDWRYVFLISVPFGAFGTAWSYWKLKELATIRKGQKIDVWGNITFGVGLTVFLIAITYGLLPYGTSTMGWGNPWVIGGLICSVALLIAFPFIETRVQDPMFRLDLFKRRAFAAGNFAAFLASISRGGVSLLLIILLQAIWLPLHGINYAGYSSLGRDLHASVYRGVLGDGSTQRLPLRQVWCEGLLDCGHAHNGSWVLSAFNVPIQFCLPFFRCGHFLDGIRYGYVCFSEYSIRNELGASRAQGRRFRDEEHNAEYGFGDRS